MADWKLKKGFQQNRSLLADNLKNTDLVSRWRAGLFMYKCSQVRVTAASCLESGGRSILEMILPQLGIKRQFPQ